MTTARLIPIDTDLTDESLEVSGRAEPMHVGGGMLQLDADTDGDYGGMTTEIELCYMADGGVCPSGGRCLGVDGGKAIYIKSVTVTETS